ncbi:MAG: sigma-54 dependent transcriptional regulator [Puniceicoccales bacterium]|jgi:two-component system nitrogen regulation response regulator GlnG|nr:sigma-54 dependent transcriptional regulator [Puniceicoccales bacterium]
MAKPTANTPKTKTAAAPAARTSPKAPGPKILVVDDDKDLRYSLRRVLAAQGYEVSEAGSGEEALRVVGAVAPDVILLDNRMGGMSGIETLQHLRTKAPDVMTVLMTAFGTTQTTIEAMQFGAFDYIMKPFETPKLLEVVRGALQTLADQMAAKGDYKPLINSADYQEGIVGNSEAMQVVIKTIGRVAASDATVLITGESGTGKELVARCLHQHSLRSKAAFCAVNCAAIPENLIESELFGHERGSFTGASGQKPGKFELCDGGTIFLDEIGDMSLPTQTKILRALQEGEIQRVGGTGVIKVNVRLVAATNKDLEQLVEEGKFREDLYYRLNVVRLRLPPLRERKEDIPLLVDFMFQRLAARRKIKARRLAAEALAALVAYDWPGNVRELENAIFRASVIARGETVLLDDLPPEVSAAAPAPAPVVAAAGDGAADWAVAADAAGGCRAAAGGALDGLTAAAGTGGAPDPAAVERFFDAVYKFARVCFKTDILLPLRDALVWRAFDEVEGNFVNTARIAGVDRSTVKKIVKVPRHAAKTAAPAKAQGAKTSKKTPAPTPAPTPVPKAPAKASAKSAPSPAPSPARRGAPAPSKKAADKKARGR